MAANQRDLSFLLESDKYLASLPTIYRTMRTDEEDANKTEASKILAQEGIGSARDIISSLGLTSAKDIIAREKEQTDKLLTEKPATTPTTTTPGTSTTPTTTAPVSTKPPELPALKTLEGIKKEQTDLNKNQEDLMNRLVSKQIAPDDYTKQMQALVDQRYNLSKERSAAERAERERKKQEEKEKVNAENLARENAVKNSIDTKMQNILNSPELLEEAERRYGDSARFQQEVVSKDPSLLLLAEEPWAIFLDAREQLLYNSLSIQEKDYFQKVKNSKIQNTQKQVEYKEKEKAFIQDFVKKINTSVNTNSIDTPKFGEIDLSKVEPVGKGYLTSGKMLSEAEANPRPVQGGQELYAAQQEWKRKVKEIEDNASLNLTTKMQLKRQLGDMPKEVAPSKPTAVTNYYYEMGDYVFLPEDVVTKGVSGAGGYYYNTSFLDKDTWVNLLEKSQPIDLGAVQEGGFKAGDASLNKGFLFKKEDWGFFNKTLETKWYANNFNNAYGPADYPILGIANVNGELKYVRQAGYNVGDDFVHTFTIDKNGQAYAQFKTEKNYSGLRGVVQDVAQGFSKIPLAPEIIGMATGSPALYASLKAFQTAGAGGDLGDVAKAGAVAYAGAKVTANMASYGQSVGSSIAATTGISTGAANFIGGAIVGSATNGVIASVTGGDVNKAMLAGAVGGGFSASAAEFTNTVLGGEANVANIAKSVNLKPEQFQQIFTGAVANGAIAAGVYDKDFVETFSQSLITGGLSVAAANAVSKSLGENVSPAQRKLIAQNTALFVRTAAYASINNVEIDEAIKAVAPKAVADTLGQGIREALKSNTK